MILHGVLSLDVGGLERIVVSLVNHQQDAVVLCVETPGAMSNEVLGMICLQKPPGRDKRFIDTAEAALRECTPDVVHTHQIGAAWYLAPAAKRLGLRVVHTEHGNPFARAKSWSEWFKLRLLMRSAAKHIDVFATVSPEIAASVKRFGTVPAHKVIVVPNGIEMPTASKARAAIRTELGIPQDAFVIGSVGRLHEVKQYHLLIEAVKPMQDTCLLLVGDGPDRARLQAMGNERIVFAGHQANPIDYLQAMDVFALSSRSEGFPVSLLEAWSAKLPIVVHAVGGIPAIVDDGVDGILIPPGSAFVPAFESLRNPALRTRLGNAGFQKLVRQFTLEQMAKRYQELYDADR